MATKDELTGVWIQGTVTDYGLSEEDWDVELPDGYDVDLKTALSLFDGKKVKVTIEVIDEFDTTN